MMQSTVVALRPGIEGVQTGVVRQFFSQSRVWRIEQDISRLNVFLRDTLVPRSNIPHILVGMRVKYEMRYERQGELWVTALWPMITMENQETGASSSNLTSIAHLNQTSDPWLEQVQLGRLWYDALSYKGRVTIAGFGHDLFVSRDMYLRAGGLPDVSVDSKPVKVKLKKSPGLFGGYETDQIAFFS